MQHVKVFLPMLLGHNIPPLFTHLVFEESLGKHLVDVQLGPPTHEHVEPGAQSFVFVKHWKYGLSPPLALLLRSVRLRFC